MSQHCGDVHISKGPGPTNAVTGVTFSEMKDVEEESFDLHKQRTPLTVVLYMLFGLFLYLYIFEIILVLTLTFVAWLTYFYIQDYKLEEVNPTETWNCDSESTRKEHTGSDVRKVLTHIAEGMDDIKTRSFPDHERTVSLSKLNHEKKYLRDKLTDAMRLILNTLDRLSIDAENAEQAKPKGVDTPTDHSNQTKSTQAHSSAEPARGHSIESCLYPSARPLKRSPTPIHSTDCPKLNSHESSMQEYASTQFDSLEDFKHGHEHARHRFEQIIAATSSDKYEEIQPALIDIQDKLREIQEGTLNGLMAGIFRTLDQPQCGALEKDNPRLKQMKQDVIERQTGVIETQRQVIKEKEKIIEVKQKVVQKQQNAIKGKRAIIKENRDVIEKQKDIMGEKQRVLNEQQEVIKEKQSMVDEKHKFIEEQQKLIKEKQAVIEEEQATIEDFKVVMEEQRRAIEDRDNAIEEKERIIKEMQQIVEVGDIHENEVVCEEKIYKALTAFSTGKLAQFKRNKRN